MTKNDWIYAAVGVFAAGGLLIGGGLLLGGWLGRQTGSETSVSAAVTTAVTQAEARAANAVGEHPLVAASTPEGPYRIVLSGEKLLVFAAGIETPFEVYELSPAWLPDFDRLMLEYGIEVQDTAALRGLLEDYLS